MPAVLSASYGSFEPVLKIPSGNLKVLFSSNFETPFVKRKLGTRASHDSTSFCEEQRMLALGSAKKVTVHLNEDTSSHDDYLYRVIIDFLLARGVQGATVIRGAAGFGPQHHLHASGADGATGQHLPLRIEFIESIEKMDALLPPLLELVSDGLIEAQDTMVLKTAAQERRY
jgi:hypothetical protein